MDNLNQMERKYQTDDGMQTSPLDLSITGPSGPLFTDVRPFECSVCAKKFSYKCSFLRHYFEVHTEERRSFECRECHKKFNRACDLRIHLRVHTGERPYECEICHKKFTQGSNLYRHHRMIHTADKPASSALYSLRKFSEERR